MRLTRSLSFRARLILGSAALSGVVLLVFIGATAYMVFDNMTEEADQELREQSEEIFALAQDGGISPGGAPYRAIASISAEEAELVLIELESPSGEVLSREPDWPTKEGDLKFTPGGWLKTEKAEGRLWRVMNRASNGWRMRLAIDLREVRDEVMKMVERYLRALPVALILIALGAWWLGNRVVRPVRAIIATAEKITAEGFGERIEEVATKDEIGRLTRVLNQMVARLESAFQQSRRFSSDASHELRTPLAVMQGKIESELQRSERGADHPLLVELLDQVQNLKSIVDSLLMFSRSDSGNLQIPDEAIDLSVLVADVAEDAAMLAEEAGVAFEVHVKAGVSAKGDARLMKLAIFNLLQNAVKYNLTEGGWVRGELGEDGTVKVTNTGAEIVGSDVEKIFDRFYRADPSRSSSHGSAGFGLGLSLARMIAEAHGGELCLISSRGGETQFAIRFGRRGVPASIPKAPRSPS